MKYKTSFRIRINSQIELQPIVSVFTCKQGHSHGLFPNLSFSKLYLTSCCTQLFVQTDACLEVFKTFLIDAEKFFSWSDTRRFHLFDLKILPNLVGTCRHSIVLHWQCALWKYVAWRFIGVQSLQFRREV